MLEWINKRLPAKVLKLTPPLESANKHHCLLHATIFFLNSDASQILYHVKEDPFLQRKKQKTRSWHGLTSPSLFSVADWHSVCTPWSHWVHQIPPWSNWGPALLSHTISLTLSPCVPIPDLQLWPQTVVQYKDHTKHACDVIVPLFVFTLGCT